MPLAYDPEYSKCLEKLLPVLSSQPKLEVHDVEGRRELIKGFVELANTPTAPGITINTIKIKSYDGAEIDVLHIRPDDTPQETQRPAYLYVHGGGMIAGSAALFANAVSYAVAATNIQFFSVDYRKAPEHKSPTQTEDVYAALLWLHQNVTQFNIDPARIGITGESSGGGIAAGVAIMARDRGLSPPLAKQVLIYPMLDDRHLAPIDGMDQLAFWKAEDNLTGWTAYLGDAVGGNHVSPYAAPARIESANGLPALYMDVSELDIFKMECMDYAARLSRASISVEFHLYPGLPHGWEAIAPTIPTTLKALENRYNAWKAI